MYVAAAIVLYLSLYILRIFKSCLLIVGNYIDTDPTTTFMIEEVM